MFNEVEVREIALKHALLNAVKHSGKADVKAVMSKIMGERPDLRKFARDVLKIVEEAVNYVNSLSLEEQRRIIQERWPELLEEKKVEVRKDIETLPPLPNADKYSIIVLRFAPNPDFVLTLGNARPAIINYAYKLKYEALGKKAKFILRFEDTDPKVKKPMLEAYDMIVKDLEWLGIKPDEIYIQSERVRQGVYYDIAKKLIERGVAYVCTCLEDEWRKYRDAGQPCPCREQPPEVHLERWEKMLRGEFDEGQAVVRIKTDLAHPDPSVRDWVALRIVNPHKHPHPRILHLYGRNEAEKYWVWPTYNFAVAVDDHLMSVTHVLRAQEHAVNTVKQSYVFKYMGWPQPETIHFGRLMIEGATLSKSKLKALGIRYDDPRLPTLAGLRERGILPETIWELMLQVGVKPSDAKLSLENIFAINRKHVEPRANRYMAVIDPVELIVTGIDKSELIAEIPYHPSYPERGKRTIKLSVKNGEVRVYVSRHDVETLQRDRYLRLMELMNIEFDHVEPDGRVVAKLHSYGVDVARKMKMQIVQWCPVEDNVKVIVERVDKTDLKSREFVKEIGLGEPSLRNVKPGEYLQFMRYGFVKVLYVQEGRVLVRFVHE